MSDVCKHCGHTREQHQFWTDTDDPNEPGFGDDWVRCGVEGCECWEDGFEGGDHGTT